MEGTSQKSYKFAEKCGDHPKLRSKTSSAWLQTNLRFASGFQNLVKQSISCKNLGHFGIYFLKIRQLVQKL